MRYYVKLDGETVVAIFRVSGTRGEYLTRAGTWVVDPTVTTATMFDTDVSEAKSWPITERLIQRFLSRKGVLTP